MSESYLSLQVLVVCFILAFHIISSHIIEKFNIKWLHESSISIIIGLICAAMLKELTNEIISFDTNIFFSIILPPIIFAQGYNIRDNHFFRNFNQIIYYGIIGTIIQFIILSLIIVAACYSLDLFKQQIQTKDIFLLSSVLCATDTVAAVSLIKPSQYPMLNSILFGEGVFNDAVSIVIFKAVLEFFNSQQNAEQSVSITSYFSILFNFLVMLVVSIGVGIIGGVLISLFFKKFKGYNQTPIKEISIILLVGQSVYLICEHFEFSGILSIFVCGIVMGHYTYRNISKESQEGTKLAFESIGYLAECFVFVYLGITIVSLDFNIIPYGFTLVILLSLMFSRFIVVISLPMIQKCINQKITLKFKEYLIIWYSGLIRGAIAFALILQMASKDGKIDTKYNEIINSVVIIIIFTVLLFGSLLQIFMEVIGLEQEDIVENIQNSLITNVNTNVSSYDKIDNAQSIKGMLQQFEITYIKPFLTRAKAKSNQYQQHSVELT